MKVTVEIPNPLYESLRLRAVERGVSMRPLILEALELSYSKSRKGKRVTGPMLKLRGKLGPRFPVDENPHDLIFG